MVVKGPRRFGRIVVAVFESESVEVLVDVDVDVTDTVIVTDESVSVAVSVAEFVPDGLSAILSRLLLFARLYPAFVGDGWLCTAYSGDVADKMRKRRISTNTGSSNH